MSAKARRTDKSSNGPHDASVSAATESEGPSSDARIPDSAMLDQQLRHQMIARAAYCRAEKRGFGGGAEAQLHDWLEAETEIDLMLAGTSIKP